MDPDDRVVQSVRSPVVVGPTSTVGPEELSQRGRRIPTTSFPLEHFPHCCPGVKRASSIPCYFVGTRAFSSSNQFNTTLICAGADAFWLWPALPIPIIRPSGVMSNDRRTRRIGNAESSRHRHRIHERETRLRPDCDDHELVRVGHVEQLFAVSRPERPCFTIVSDNRITALESDRILATVAPRAT